MKKQENFSLGTFHPISRVLSTTMEYSNMPVIDISSLLKESDDLIDSECFKRIGEEIEKALKDFGFFYIVGHSLPLKEFLHEVNDFFKENESYKKEIELKGFRGWSSLGSEITKGKKDWHECLDIMTESETYLDTKQSLFTSKNQFPRDREKFKTLSDEYVCKCKLIGLRLLESLSLVYNKDPRTFTNGFMNEQEPFWVLRCLNYPFLNNNNLDSNIGLGVGEHTDYGWLTMIHSNEEGLEIFSSVDSKWKAVKVIPDSLIVNIGDMLSFCTGSILKATPHRVKRVHKERTSLAFFFDPSPQTIIYPLNETKDGEERKGIHYGTYLQGKYESSYPSYTLAEEEKR